MMGSNELLSELIYEFSFFNLGHREVKMTAFIITSGYVKCVFSFFRAQMLRPRIRNKRNPNSKMQRKYRKRTSRSTLRRSSQRRERFVFSETHY